MKAFERTLCNAESMSHSFVPVGSRSDSLSLSAVATYPPSDSICDFDQGLCGWTHDRNAPLLWTLHSHGGESQSEEVPA